MIVATEKPNQGERILRADGSLISDGNQAFHRLEPSLHFSFADRSPKNHYDAQFIYPLCMISSVPDSKQQSRLWREENIAEYKAGYKASYSFHENVCTNESRTFLVWWVRR